MVSIAPDITCPRCGTVQAPAPVCIACGFEFAAKPRTTGAGTQAVRAPAGVDPAAPKTAPGRPAQRTTGAGVPAMPAPAPAAPSGAAAASPASPASPAAKKGGPPVKGGKPGGELPAKKPLFVVPRQTVAGVPLVLAVPAVLLAGAVVWFWLFRSNLSDAKALLVRRIYDVPVRIEPDLARDEAIAAAVRYVANYTRDEIGRLGGVLDVPEDVDVSDVAATPEHLNEAGVLGNADEYRTLLVSARFHYRSLLLRAPVAFTIHRPFGVSEYLSTARARAAEVEAQRLAESEALARRAEEDLRKPAYPTPPADEDGYNRVDIENAPIRTDKPYAAPPNPGTVIIYGAPWCKYTQAARKVFDDASVRYELRNIENDPFAVEDMRQKTKAAGKRSDTIPTVDYRGQIVTGYNRVELTGLARR